MTATGPRTLREHDDPIAPRWILDAGHGWLEVSLHAFPDALDYGTGYGYHDPRAGVAYLEEDCEAGAFIAGHGLDDKAGRWTVLDYSMTGTGDAPCRHLPRIPARYALPA
jgi:hypothetical protein